MTRGIGIALAVAALLTIAGIAMVVATRQAGVPLAEVELTFVIPLVAAVVTTTGSAAWLAVRGERGIARGLGAVGAGLVLYLLLSAASAWYAGALGMRDALAVALVTVSPLWYVVGMVALAVTFVAVRDRLAAVARSRLHGYAVAMGVAAALTIVLGAAFTAVSDPVQYAGVGPPVPVPAPVGEAIGWAVTIPWMLGVLLAPVLLWRAVPGSVGHRRARLALAAASSLVPLCAIVLCVLGGRLAFEAGLLAPAAAESALGVAYGAAFLFTPLGIAAAVGSTTSWVTSAAPRITAAAVTGTLGALAAMVIVFLGSLLGGRLDEGGPVPVVIGTLVMAGALVPVHRALVRALTLRMDPARAAAARLVRAGDPDLRTSPGVAAQHILCVALADPTARLLLLRPDGRGWADPSGEPVADPGPHGHPITGPAGTPHAFLELAGDPENAAGAVAEIATLVELAVLELAVRDHTRTIEAERARAEEAATTERRRLERDLHDGAQGRLLALALQLRIAQRTITDGEAQLVLTDTVDGLRAAIDELRTLAAGTAPDLLARGGLPRALADLTGRVPLPIALSLPRERLPGGTEAVAYLVICEAITNALKHAGASAIEVDVTVHERAAEGSVAVIEVRDDGRGGADLRAGTGLRGLAERVGAAGGQFVVSDRDPHGTRLEATLPCAP